MTIKCTKTKVENSPLPGKKKTQWDASHWQEKVHHMTNRSIRLGFNFFHYSVICGITNIVVLKDEQVLIQVLWSSMVKTKQSQCYLVMPGANYEVVSCKCKY